MKNILLSIFVLSLFVNFSCKTPQLNTTKTVHSGDTLVKTHADTLGVPVPEKNFSFPFIGGGILTATPGVLFETRDVPIIIPDIENKGATIEYINNYIKVKVPADTIYYPVFLHDTIFNNRDSVFVEDKTKVDKLTKQLATENKWKWVFIILSAVLAVLILAIVYIYTSTVKKII